MKKRMGLLLSAGALAFGAVAFGLVGADAAGSANAAAGDYTSNIQLVGGCLGVGWTNTANTAYQFVEQADGTFAWTGSFTVERFRAVVPGSWTKALDWDNVVAASEKVADGTFVKASTVGTDGDNNIWCTVAGVYTLTLDSAKTALSIVTANVTQYDVSEFAVVNGTAETTAFATEKAKEGYAFTPTNVVRSGYHFEGWFTDAACTSAYAATTWTAAGNLYAKYSTLADRTLYSQTVSGWTKTYVYSYGGSGEFGTWPGKEVTAVTDGISYQSLGGIIKITFSNVYDDTYFILNDGTLSGGAVGTNQSHNLKIANGAYYWFTAADDSTGDADKGSAAAVVYDINEARRAVVKSGSSILAGSLCGVSQAKATALVAEYDALNATAKGYADAATDYTYNSTQPEGQKVNPSIADMVVQLRRIASGGSGAMVIDSNDTSLTPMIVTVISFGVIVVASAGLWIARRKER